MLLPGVGFDVVPSDCLAAHLKGRLPDANDLKLFLSLGNDMSRGTAKTMVEAIATGTRLRRNGRIVTRDRAEEGSCDFGKGEKSTIQVSWGDVATAFHSTGIPNIEVHFQASPAIRALRVRPGSSSRSSDWASRKASSSTKATATWCVTVGVKEQGSGQP
jgi:short subunit dehydrogenase-like uncharacterized protein